MLKIICYVLNFLFSLFLMLPYIIAIIPVKDKELEDMGIIGGNNGPTAVFIVEKHALKVVIFFILLLVLNIYVMVKK